MGFPCLASISSGHEISLFLSVALKLNCYALSLSHSPLNKKKKQKTKKTNKTKKKKKKKKKKNKIIKFFENLKDYAWDTFLAHEVLLNSLFVSIESSISDFCCKFSKLNEFEFWVSMWSFKVWNDSRNIGPTQMISLKPNG